MYSSIQVELMKQKH